MAVQNLTTEAGFLVITYELNGIPERIAIAELKDYWQSVKIRLKDKNEYTSRNYRNSR